MGKIKYPRTMHLPWSPGATADDRIVDHSVLQEVASEPMVVTEKMDGGNVTLMKDCFYARSLDSGTQPWDKYSKSVWSQVAHDIPDGWRVSAESMWARRSVAYDNLNGPLLVFGVWDYESNLLSWPETVEWAALLGLPTVPVIGGTVGVDRTHSLWTDSRDEDTSEGFVVRHSGVIPAGMFHRRVFKWVRAGHVRTDAGWRNRDDFATNSFRAGGAEPMR